MPKPLKEFKGKTTMTVIPSSDPGFLSPSAYRFFAGTRRNTPSGSGIGFQGIPRVPACKQFVQALDVANRG
jgi:hypothetical protein